MMAMFDDEIKKKVKEYTESANREKEVRIKALNESYQPAIDAAKESTANRIAEVEAGYDDLFRKNAVQEEINRRKIAEAQANLGLTESGLTASQLTANVLAKGRADSEYQLQLQKSKDALSLQLKEYLAGIEQEKAKNKSGIEANTYDEIASYTSGLQNNAIQQEAAIEKARIDAQTALQKAAIQASGKTGTSTKKLTFTEYGKVIDKAAAYAANEDWEGLESYVDSMNRAGYLSDEDAVAILNRYDKNPKVIGTANPVKTSGTGTKGGGSANAGTAGKSGPLFQPVKNGYNFDLLGPKNAKK